MLTVSHLVSTFINYNRFDGKQPLKKELRNTPQFFFDRAGAERIELPLMVLETTVIPLDQAPVLILQLNKIITAGELMSSAGDVSDSLSLQKIKKLHIMIRSNDFVNGV